VPPSEIHVPSNMATSVPHQAGDITWPPAAEVLAIGFLCSMLLGQVAKVPLVSTDIKTASILVSDLVAAALGAWLVASVLVAGRIRLDRPIILFAGFVAVNALAIAVTAVRFDLTVGQVAFSSL
jgi:hypothetical protein